MHILITCLSKSWGGMEMFAVSNLLLLTKSGYTATVACLKNSPIHIELLKHNIPHIIFNSPVVCLSNILKFAFSLNRKKYDLIHTHYSKDLWLIVPALKLLRSSLPLVMTKHLGSSVKKKDILHKVIYKRLNSAIAISEVIKTNLIETTPIDEEDISLLHNYVDLNLYKKQRHPNVSLCSEFNIGKSDFVLGMVARITPGKGHEDVINAVNILAKGNYKFKIIVAGASSQNEKAYEESLKDKIHSLALDNYFIFTGFRDDIPDLLSLFDVFLFPSHAEAFGLALLEAMAAGIPSIVCYSDGVKDIAVEGVTSLTFDRNDFTSLAQHIKTLINNNKLKKELSYNSIIRSAYFSQEVFLNKLNSLYTRLVFKNQTK